MFAVVALLIIALVLIVYMFIKSPAQDFKDIAKTLTFQGLVDSTKEFLTSCSNDVLNNGVMKISGNGGYYKIPEFKKIQTSYGEMTLVYDKKSFLISREEMSRELLDYVEDNIESYCDVSKLKNVNVNGEFSGNVVISDNKIRLEGTWPVEVSRGDSSAKIDKIYSEANVRLGLVRDSADNILSDVGRSNMKMDDKIDIGIIEEENYLV